MTVPSKASIAPVRITGRTDRRSATNSDYLLYSTCVGAGSGFRVLGSWLGSCVRFVQVPRGFTGSGFLGSEFQVRQLESDGDIRKPGTWSPALGTRHLEPGRYGPATLVTKLSGDLGNTFRQRHPAHGGAMPWRERSPMDERVQFITDYQRQLFTMTSCASGTASVARPDTIGRSL